MPVSLYIVHLLLYTPWSSCVSLYLSSYHIVICAESQINLQTCIHTHHEDMSLTPHTNLLLPLIVYLYMYTIVNTSVVTQQ